ncbi:NUDIX domain-containing protein [Patescibacteria group bacterium]|nr:NUDIX domain-containing protein [Patescibacteria group bacterium]MBU4512102.1 NUDIX domain-containing protein [Patescibacteria group bacterium]MCG2693117.1 NUDIX domain-containing protein [Candidatus Parcubacteria bacterium]
MHTHRANLEVIVRAVIQKDDKLLVCHEKGSDHYFTPGGHIEPGESAEEALKRELKEELDLTIKKSFFIGAVENIFTLYPRGSGFTQDREEHHELILNYKVEALDVKDKSLEDHIDFFFFDIGRFSKEAVLPIVLRESILKWLKDKKIFWASQIGDKAILHP